MTLRDIIGTVTIAVCALALTGAVIYQAIEQGKPDGELMGLLGLLVGAFLRTPGQSAVQISQPADRPVPTQEVP